MNEGNIIFLKSAGPRMIIEKVVPQKSEEGGLDNLQEDALAIAPHARVGDYAVKWGPDEKPIRDILGKETVIDDLDNVIDKENDNIKLGSVVKSKLNDTEMTVTWIVGETTNPDATFDYNEVLIARMQRAKGDLVCRWFEDEELKTTYYTPIEVDKIKE